MRDARNQGLAPPGYNMPPLPGLGVASRVVRRRSIGQPPTIDQRPAGSGV
ncbi:hypothetical protein PLANPX_0777 [Lacipirellula parvula]|uniref:Uncharacterized protein n=1 Tax=Lacipirellula parvula TaxID=2650471 RepID=A0A5K7X459_9BACT|nr:hypothetical protein PLANPX_0777 [Lacipirellula parvula]